MMPRLIAVMYCIASAALGGCSISQTAHPVSSPTGQSFLLDERDFGVTARDLAQVADIASLASRVDRVKPGAPASRRLRADFLPLISNSFAGRRFLAMSEARALVIGEPQARCPALEAAGGPDAAVAVETAMGACLARLESLAPDAECGCRLLVSGDTLLAPRPDFAYATGLSTRALREGRLDQTRYVAVEEMSADGVETVIYAGERPVWRVVPGEGRMAMLVSLEPGAEPPRDVARQVLGIDRGRFIERIEAGDLTLLIGF